MPALRQRGAGTLPISGTTTSGCPTTWPLWRKSSKRQVAMWPYQAASITARQAPTYWTSPASSKIRKTPADTSFHRRHSRIACPWRLKSAAGEPRTRYALRLIADFLLRSVDAGARFVSTGRVTAHKFAAGHRYLSYLEQSSAEQREMLAAIRCGAIDRWTCADYVKRAKAAGSFMQMMYPDFDALGPGDLYRANRSNKGLERVASVPLTEEVHVLPSNEPRALDWYGIEQPAGSPPFRFSGPSLRPKLLIPFTGDIPARITLHLLARITFPLADYDPEGIIDGIRLTLNGSAIEHQTRRDHPNRIDIDLTGRLRPEQPSVLELLLPRAFCPADARWRRIWSLVSGRNLDRRRLGVALIGFTVAPVAPGDMRNGRANAITSPAGIAPVPGPVARARLPGLAVAGGALLWLVRKLRSRLSRR